MSTLVRITQGRLVPHGTGGGQTIVTGPALEVQTAEPVTLDIEATVAVALISDVLRMDISPPIIIEMEDEIDAEIAR